MPALRVALSPLRQPPHNPNACWNLYQLRDLRSRPCPPQATKYRTQGLQDRAPAPESTWDSGQLEHRVTMVTPQRWYRP